MEVIEKYIPLILAITLTVGGAALIAAAKAGHARASLLLL
jgi:hypothetical protein